MSTDTRSDTRTGVSVKVRFKSTTLDDFIERYSVDISRGGMFIRTRDPLAVGTVIKFEFTLDDSSPVLVGDATVVWRREHDPQRPGAPAGMGVKFDALTAESRAVLDRIIEAKQKADAAQAHPIGSSQPIPVMDEDDEVNRQPTKVAALDEIMGGQNEDTLEPHERTVVAHAKSAELARRSTLDGVTPVSLNRPLTSPAVVPRASTPPPMPVAAAAPPDVPNTGSDEAPTGAIVAPAASHAPPAEYAPPMFTPPPPTFTPPPYQPPVQPSMSQSSAGVAPVVASLLAQGTGPGAPMDGIALGPAIAPQRRIFWVLGLIGGAGLIAGGLALVVHGGRSEPKRTIVATATEEEAVATPVEPVKPMPKSGPVDIEVVTHPEGAQLHIDGQPFDQPTPTILRGLDAKKAVKLVAVHECYEPAALEVQPDPGRPVEIVLKPKAYTLTLNSTPPGAIVRIDGREVGATPKQVQLGKGDLDHALLVTLTRAGFAEKVVSFDPRQTCDDGKGTVSVTLKR